MVNKHLFGLCLLLLLPKCNQSQTPLLENLPNAVYPISHPIDYGFGDWFAIKLNNDSMSCSFAKSYHPISNFGELEEYLCAEYFKKNKAESNKKPEEERIYRTLILEIDSATRYGLFDQTVEALKHLNLNKFYIRTRSTNDMISGFSVVFPEMLEAAKPALAKLYGEKMISTYDVFLDCFGEKRPLPPPGVPPPPALPDSLRFLTPVEKLRSIVKTGNFGKNILIEMHDGQLYLNKKQSSFNDLISAVQKPKSGYEFYIMLHDKNNFGELIKIIDILNVSREKLNNTIAQNLYGMDFQNLDRYQKGEVRQEEPFQWLIVSMAEQLYVTGN
jgi:biopolymer transport protein ExbD